MIQIGKFLEWVNNNNMHVLLEPTLDEDRMASLEEGQYSGVYGHITKSLGNDDIICHDSNQFYFALGDYESDSICGYGKTDKEAVIDLCLILTRQKDKDRFGKKYEPITEIINNFPGRSSDDIKIKIPQIEEFI